MTAYSTDAAGAVLARLVGTGAVTVQPAQPAITVIPGAARAASQPCSAFIFRRRPCPTAAAWRVVITCPTCGLDGLRLMCEQHKTKAVTGGLVCHACWKRGGQLVALGIAAVEPL